MVMSLRQINKAQDGREDINNLKIKLGRIRLAMNTSKSIVFFNNMAVERIKRNRETTGNEPLAFTITPLDEYPPYMRLMAETTHLNKELVELDKAREDTEKRIAALAV